MARSIGTARKVVAAVTMLNADTPTGAALRDLLAPYLAILRDCLEHDPVPAVDEIVAWLRGGRTQKLSPLAYSVYYVVRLEIGPRWPSVVRQLGYKGRVSNPRRDTHRRTGQQWRVLYDLVLSGRTSDVRICRRVDPAWPTTAGGCRRPYFDRRGDPRKVYCGSTCAHLASRVEFGKRQREIEQKQKLAKVATAAKAYVKLKRPPCDRTTWISRRTGISPHWITRHRKARVHSGPPVTPPVASKRLLRPRVGLTYL